MLLILLSLWMAIQDSHQACNAMYPYQVIGDPVPWIYLVPPLDDQLYVPCAGNYTATAYSGDPNKGLGNLSMEYFASISGQYGILTITSGDGTHPADSITITSSDDAKKYVNWVSTSPNVTITWQQNGTKAYDFSGALMETPTLQQSTVIPSTSPAPTTRAYTPGYVDPWLVSHDLFIGIDAGMKPSAQFFDDMKNLALNFSTQFELYAGPFTTAPKSHTRVSILQLTPVDKYATNGGLWEHTNGSITLVLGGMIHYNADIANYTNTLKEAADQAFTVREPGSLNDAQGTRPHAMRTFIIFTNQAPKDIAALNAPCVEETSGDYPTICNIFQSKDIRLIVAGYQVDDIPRSNFTYKNSWYKYTDVDANNWDNYFTKIIAKFFTNSTGHSYQVCDASNPNQTIGQPYLTISLAPPIDDYNFQPCAGNYETYANSGNPTQGLGNLKINSFDSCTGTTLTLKNTDPQETVFCVVKTQADAESDPCKSAISSTPVIKIVWTQTTGCLSQFTGTLSNTSALAGSTPAPATTPPFTTRQYTPGVVDPWLVSHDLYFGIDLGAKPDDATFGEMISLTNNFVQLLNIVDGPFNVTPPAYTRASVLELTPHNSYATSAGIWEQTKNTLNNVFSGMIYKTGVPANYADTLRLAIPDAYELQIGQSNYVIFARGTRPNAQRTFIIFTNQLPGDFDQLKLPCDNTASICYLFKQSDVHLLIVGYKVSVADDAAFSDPDNWFSYTSVTNNDTATAMLIINGFFTNADGLCKNDQETELFVGQQFSTTPQPPIPAANSRTENPTCLMIFHDLEIERDFLRVYEIGDNDYELTEIASHQACGALYPNQTIGQPNPIIYILPPYDDINNKPCGGNYEAYASSGNPNQGLGNFQITNFVNEKGGTLMIKNTDAIGSIFCVIRNDGDDVTKCQGKVSLTPTVKIIWTQTDLNYIFQFSASLINTTAHGPAPNVTTSAPITTRTYTPGYVDPWLISHDLFVAIDAGSKPSIQSYNEMKALANNTLQQFNVINDTFDIAPPAYTRVSMLELTPLDEYVPNGALWSLTNNSIGANLAGMLTYTATPANYTNTLKMAVQQAFKIRQYDNITGPDGKLYTQGTRIHAQRTIVIFTNQVPDDFSNIIASCTNNVDSPTTLCDFFLSYDVRLLIVGYKVSPADNTALSNNWFSYINVTNFDVPTAMQIIGQFFTNADGLCKPRYSKDIVINETRNDTSDPPPYFYEPKYYNGPTMFNNTNIWGAADGQKYRYCNFHYNRYNILNTATNTTATPTCLIVFYELEIERDFLRIYELGNDLHDLTEISSLTGKDVLGSVIQSTRNLTVIFSTDYMEVYGGFYVYAMTGTNGKMIRLILAICAFIELSHEQCGPPYGDQYATAANPYVYMLPPFDPSSGGYCAGNYDANAYTDDPGRGFGNLMVEKWKCDGQNGTLTIRNKNNPDQIFKIITENVVDPTFITSQNIIMEWRQDGTTPCTFSGNLTRANTVFGQVTTPRPTTVPYPTHSNWNDSLGIDPWLITHDLMIGIDSGNKSDDNKWTKTLIFVSFIENQLNILGGTPAYKNEKAYTRITLMQLTPMGNFDTHGPIWEMDSDGFSKVLGSLQYTRSGLAKYTPGMVKAADEAFKIYGEGRNFSATRNHTQRTFLLITDSLPVDTSFFALPTISGSVAEAFQDTDTHLLIIGFGTFDDSLYRENNGSWFTYVQVDDANQKTAAMQVVQLLTRPDPFCFTSSSQWGNIMLKTGEPIVIKEPYYYYSGPPVNGKKQWGAKDGQKYRYCNFQNSVAVIQNFNYANPSTPDGPTGQPYAPMCLMIFHELEVEFDYVKVYLGSELDPDQEIGYFTGLEVTGSYLEIPYSDSITIEFRTNNREVFGGFYLTVEAKSCPTFTTPPNR